MLKRMVGLCAKQTPSQEYTFAELTPSQDYIREADANRVLSKVLSSRGRAPGVLEQSRVSQWEGVGKSGGSTGLGSDYRRPEWDMWEGGGVENGEESGEGSWEENGEESREGSGDESGEESGEGSGDQSGEEGGWGVQRVGRVEEERVLLSRPSLPPRSTREQQVLDSREGPDPLRSFRGGELSRSQREYLNQQKMLYQNLERRAAKKALRDEENQEAVLTRGPAGFPLPKREVQKLARKAKMVATRAARTLDLAVRDLLIL
jgi:hypothetical protein